MRCSAHRPASSSFPCGRLPASSRFLYPQTSRREDPHLEHDFVIEGETAASIPLIAPGKSEKLRVTLKPGEYRLMCNLPGHKEAGMVGMLKVEE
ncbi:MAG: hypothetical protein HY731_00665 [Candidatus Tectomicrobia bacterium]|nr:hypothetical protein [Candidatus Tectomicrobia bacterium]